MMKVSVVVVVVVAALVVASSAQSVPSPEGVDALLSLWGDTDGPNSWCLSCPQVNPCGWNASSTPCSQTVGWSGVGCGGGGNVLLNLPTSCISGTLPAALFPANSGVLLTELVANGNNLQGPLPSEMFTFNAPTVPGDGGPLLLSFVGTDNAQLLSSGLPATFATSILQNFRCSNCGLQTPPTAVPQVVNTLELADNALTSFPFNTIFPVIPLQTLDLQRNAITGALPTSELETLSTLLSVRLDGNQFTGTLPSTYANMPLIAELGLSSNSLSGPIPSEWGFTGNSSSPQMQRIRLAGNSLTGTIPTQLGANTMLFELTLGSNSLQGTLPSELASLNVSNVRGPVFDVSNAGLSGPIPTHYEAWSASHLFASADQCDFRGNSFTCVPTPLRQGGFCQFDASLCDCDASGTACAAPTPAPTTSPTPAPTTSPTPAPTTSPTPAPTPLPTPAPSTAPVAAPVVAPVSAPTAAPTASPTPAPTTAPVTGPTPPSVAPTPPPTPSPGPTPPPTVAPTATPTPAPTTGPTRPPTVDPTATPTPAPTTSPTVSPTPAPVAGPTPAPTTAPTPAPTTAPTPSPPSPAASCSTPDFYFSLPFAQQPSAGQVAFLIGLLEGQSGIAAGTARQVSGSPFQVDDQWWAVLEFALCPVPLGASSAHQTFASGQNFANELVVDLVNSNQDVGALKTAGVADSVSGPARLAPLSSVANNPPSFSVPPAQGDDDGGFPIWAIVLIVVVAVIIIIIVIVLVVKLASLGSEANGGGSSATQHQQMDDFGNSQLHA